MPDPDSPTSARVSPGRMEKDSSTTAVVVPESEVNCTRRCSTSNMGELCLRRDVCFFSFHHCSCKLVGSSGIECVAAVMIPCGVWDSQTARRDRDILRRSLVMGSKKQSTCHERSPRLQKTLAFGQRNTAGRSVHC